MFKRLMAALATMFVITVGWAIDAHACDPAPNCMVSVAAGTQPACLVLYPHEDWEGTDRECNWQVWVQNHCDDPVHLVELNCGDDCLEPAVIDAGQDAFVAVRAPEHAGTLEQRLEWTVGEASGVADIVAQHNPYDGDPCAGWDGRGCQTALAPAAPGAAWLLPLLLAVWYLRRRPARAA